MKRFSNIHEIQSYNGLISDVQMWIGHYWYSRFSCFIFFAVTGWGSQWCLPAIVDVRTALSRAPWFKMSAVHGALARNEWNASRICFFLKSGRKTQKPGKTMQLSCDVLVIYKRYWCWPWILWIEWGSWGAVLFGHVLHRSFTLVHQIYW